MRLRIERKHSVLIIADAPEKSKNFIKDTENSLSSNFTFPFLTPVSHTILVVIPITRFFNFSVPHNSLLLTQPIPFPNEINTLSGIAPPAKRVYVFIHSPYQTYSTPFNASTISTWRKRRCIMTITMAENKKLNPPAHT